RSYARRRLFGGGGAEGGGWAAGGGGGPARRRPSPRRDQADRRGRLFRARRRATIWGLSIGESVPPGVAALQAATGRAGLRRGGGPWGAPCDAAGREAFGLRQGRTVAANRSSFPVRVSFHTRWKAPALAVM